MHTRLALRRLKADTTTAVAASAAVTSRFQLKGHGHRGTERARTATHQRLQDNYIAGWTVVE